MPSINELSKTYNFSKDVAAALKKVYGEAVEKVFQALKAPGERYYVRVNTLKADVGEVIDRLRARGFKVEQDRNIPEALYVPVEGPFEIPIFEKRVVADKFAAESVLQGAHLYAPGVTRCEGVRPGDEVTIVDELGQPVGSGVAMMGETQILQFRRGLAIQVTYPKYKVPSFRETEEYAEGLIYPQSLPAVLTSRILDPKPGDKVLDVACAPGGKLSHIIQLMGNEGAVVGVDRSKRKIDLTRKNLTRLGCKAFSLIAHDSRYLDVDFPSLRIDKCLVDPPCTALGVLPKLFEFSSMKDITSASNYQKQFIRSASRLLKPGGILVYSVCTMTAEECEDVARFAEECCLKLDPQSPYLGHPSVESFSEPRALQRFHPHIHGSGYFIARFRKERC
ncbi:TPA: RsmB/NOP family class I SAM-dependent RNA methyltransferase [Candidatus Bathyarchaeota archaeon]|nr:RsmB/NOP family class I SAM-dependent RNA methyltransferase [Candidatus Bathyarchaeota archaeon]